MTMLWTTSRKTFDVPCTIEIEQTSETLHAHVVLDGDIAIQPGDESWFMTRRPALPSASGWSCGEPRPWCGPARSTGYGRGSRAIWN